VNKVIVKYDEWGRMGNRMFQYTFGKILANNKQCEFYCDSLPNFHFTKLENSPKLITQINNPLYIKEKYGNNYVNYDELLNHDGDIIVNSFLQKSEYYIPYLDKIRLWFRIGLPFDTPVKLPEKDEVVMHIRETDYKNLGILLNINYYSNLIYNTNKKVTIVTDNCNSELVQNFKNRCNIFSNEPINSFNTTSTDKSMLDFIYMLYADTLILSQSTFSWWAAFLGEHSEIYFPVNSTNNKGMWKLNPNKDDIDLYIPNKNFIKVII
jgi:hypothetical protein